MSRKPGYIDPGHSVSRCAELDNTILLKGKTAVREIQKRHGKAVLKARSQALDTMSKRRRRTCEKLIEAVYRTQHNDSAHEEAIDRLNTFCEEEEEGMETMRRKYKFKCRAQKDRNFYLRLQAVAHIMHHTFGGWYGELVQCSKTMLRDYDKSREPKKKGRRGQGRYATRNRQCTARNGRARRRAGLPNVTKDEQKVQQLQESEQDQQQEGCNEVFFGSEATHSPTASDAESQATSPARRTSRVRSSSCASASASSTPATDVNLDPVPLNPIPVTPATTTSPGSSGRDTHSGETSCKRHKPLPRLHLLQAETEPQSPISDAENSHASSPAHNSPALSVHMAPPALSRSCMAQLNDIIALITKHKLTAAYNKIAQYWDINSELTMLDIYLQLLYLCPELPARFDTKFSPHHFPTNARLEPMAFALVLAPCNAPSQPPTAQDCELLRNTGIPVSW